MMTLIRKGPVRILINDGESYDVPGVEFAVVSDIAHRFFTTVPMAR